MINFYFSPFFPQDIAPPLRDCSEIERTGKYLAEGNFYLDPSGSRDKRKSVPAFCRDGWTYLLRRVGGQESWKFYRSRVYYLHGWGNLENGASSKELWFGLLPVSRSARRGSVFFLISGDDDLR